LKKKILINNIEYNKNINAMYLLAVSQEKLGDNKKAIKTYKKLIAKEKNYNFS